MIYLCHEIPVRSVVYPSPHHSTRCNIWLQLPLFSTENLSTLSAGVCQQRFPLLLLFQQFQPFVALMTPLASVKSETRTRMEKKKSTALRYSSATPTWSLASPLSSPWVCPRAPCSNSAPVTRGVLKNVLSRERRKKASGFGIGSSEKCWESTVRIL